MKPRSLRRHITVFLALTSALIVTCDSTAALKKSENESAQVPKWSVADLSFFLHGSMSTEVVPEPVFRAFLKVYPDLFPRADLSHLGLIPDPGFGWPIGFSRKEVKHLGGLRAVGLNCAACHVAEIHSPAASATVRIFGVTSHFDAEAFFGSVIVATFRTVDPANMKKFVAAYLDEINTPADEKGRAMFEHEWDAETKQITEVLTNGVGSKPGELHDISLVALKLDLQKARSPESEPFVALVRSILQLFHNMRAALHVPDQPPKDPPPASGPGRNDAFGLLSAGLLNAPQPFAPVKYGLVWNVGSRRWVHWDGNTRSPLGRNLLASLGLGAPLLGKHGELDFEMVKRQTDLTEMIEAPHYPFPIDQEAAKRGSAHFTAKCVSCHGGIENDKRLYSITEVGTDPLRAKFFTKEQATRFNKFLAGLETPGFQAPKEDGLRSTGKYWAASLAGVWARSPYLHNGSVRTMQELLSKPEQRAKTFHRGSKDYDAIQMGYTDDGTYVFDTSKSGNSNTGHTYGTTLTNEQKHDLIEYLKTL